MKLDKMEYLGVQRVLERKSAVILEEDEEGIFVYETIGDLYMLISDDSEKGKCWIEKHEPYKRTIFNVYQKELMEFIKGRYHLDVVLDCFQVVYTKEKFEIQPDLQLRQAALSDKKFILDNYDMLEDYEIEHIIQRGKLFIAEYKNEPVGFIGEHLEGTMGLLYVLEAYRKNGFGSALEKLMINHTIDEGLIPFCQVETDNEKSLGLQRKIGCDISTSHIYWVF